MEMSQENMIDAIKATREYVSDLSNICKSCGNSNQVYLWVKATDKDIQALKDEIDKAYELALAKCTGKTLNRYEMWSIYDILRSFEKVFSKEGWKVYTSTPHGSGLIENLDEGIIYFLDGWDSVKPISSGKIRNKCSVVSSKGKKIDKRILLTRHFSERAAEVIDNLKNVVLIDLGCYENGQGDISVYGDPNAQDPLVKELVTNIEKFLLNPQEFVQLIKRPERQSVDPFLVREVLRLFKENFRILDCGHLKVTERRLPFGLERRRQPFEEQLKKISVLYTDSTEGVDLNDLKNTRQKMVDKIDQLYQGEFVTSAVKKDIDKNLGKNEMLLLCKACEQTYLNKYEIPLEPCGGQTCIFKHFVNKLAQRIGYEAKYVEPYELGLLSKEADVIVVNRTGSVMQPADNIMLFKPSQFIVLDKFLSAETVEPADENGRLYLPRRPRLVLSKSDPTAIAYEYAKNYLLPALAYDWSSDEYGFVPIETKLPSMSEIVKSIVSIDYTIGATEKAYKAPHDRIVDLYEEMGLEFGFNPAKEHGLGASRVDVVWLDREKGEPKVGIEVELSGQITTDLWKLCELQPSLGVLVVKGSHYDTAVDYVTESNIVKKFNQRILIFDASEKDYSLIEGNKLVDLTDIANEDSKGDS